VIGQGEQLATFEVYLRSLDEAGAYTNDYGVTLSDSFENVQASLLANFSVHSGYRNVAHFEKWEDIKKLTKKQRNK